MRPSFGLPNTAAVSRWSGLPWRLTAANTVSADTQPADSPLVGVGAFEKSTGPVALQLSSFSSGAYSAKALPAIPEAPG